MAPRVKVAAAKSIESGKIASAAAKYLTDESGRKYMSARNKPEKTGVIPQLYAEPRKQAESNPAEPFITYEGTWVNKDTDVPVNVVGFAGEHNGRRYVYVDGSGTAIPEDEII